MFKNKKIMIPVVALIVAGIGVGVYWFNGPAKDRTVEVSVEERINNPDLNLYFEFLSGPDALSYTVSNDETEGTGDFLKAYVLMQSDKQQEFIAGNTEGQAPPAISVLVFEKTEVPETVATSGERVSSGEYLRYWAEARSGYSGSAHMTGDYEDTEVDSWSAIRFQSEPTYKQETYISRYKDHVYLFVGQYEEEGDFMHQQFQDLIASVRLE